MTKVTMERLSSGVARTPYVRVKVEINSKAADKSVRATPSYTGTSVGVLHLVLNALG
jgi:hypothetical protein